jgi:hypothetical protein
LAGAKAIDPAVDIGTPASYGNESSDSSFSSFPFSSTRVSGLYQTDPQAVANRYCTWNNALFTGYTDIDRQTELNDDYGCLTGLVGTVSVNNEPFFNAPVETPECASDVAENVPPGTARTSPYDYVTTVETPGFGYANPNRHWGQDCS